MYCYFCKQEKPTPIVKVEGIQICKPCVETLDENYTKILDVQVTAFGKKKEFEATVRNVFGVPEFQPKG